MTPDCTNSHCIQSLKRKRSVSFKNVLEEAVKNNYISILAYMSLIFCVIKCKVYKELLPTRVVSKTSTCVIEL